MNLSFKYHWKYEIIIEFQWKIIENMIIIQQFAKPGDSIPSDGWKYDWNIIKNMKMSLKYHCKYDLNHLTVCESGDSLWWSLQMSFRYH